MSLQDTSNKNPEAREAPSLTKQIIQPYVFWQVFILSALLKNISDFLTSHQFHSSVYCLNCLPSSGSEASPWFHEMGNGSFIIVIMNNYLWWLKKLTTLCEHLATQINGLLTAGIHLDCHTGHLTQSWSWGIPTRVQHHRTTSQLPASPCVSSPQALQQPSWVDTWVSRWAQLRKALEIIPQGQSTSSWLIESYTRMPGLSTRKSMPNCPTHGYWCAWHYTTLIDW